MDRDELLARDKEILVDLILRLHQRVAALEAGAGRPPTGPGNSLIPPSAGYKPNRAEPEVAAIREAVRASPAINSDETVVRGDGRNWWH